MSMIEVMSNYCSILREDIFNSFVLNLLNKFMQWFDDMAKTQSKYYNIVMLENLHYILRRAELHLAWEEWRKKRSELEEQYSTNVQNYVKSIFEYQYPKFTQYVAKIQAAIKSGDFAALTMQSEYNFKTFDKMFKATFTNVIGFTTKI